jgi:hypothetical protein
VAPSEGRHTFLSRLRTGVRHAGKDLRLRQEERARRVSRVIEFSIDVFDCLDVLGVYPLAIGPTSGY